MEIEELIKVVLSVDKNAYEQIIHRYYEEIYYYVLKQVADQEFSKELCQDIFFEAYQSLKRYNSKKASFQTWLYKIANYRCIDYLRSKAYQERLYYRDEEVECFSEPSEDVLSELILQEQTQKVNELMQSCLKTKHERIMRYHFYADLTPQEIAILEKTSVKTIYTIIDRSLKKLKEVLGGQYHE